METACFICGLDIRHGENDLPQKKFESLKRLMLVICKSFNATNIKAKDWNFLWTLPKQKSICCVKCFDLLKSVEKVHEKIAKIERELTARLNQIETLVVTSETLPVENSLWDWSCFEFRKRVITKASDSDTQVQIAQNIKEEQRERGGNDDDDVHAPDDYLVRHDWLADISMGDSLGKLEDARCMTGEKEIVGDAESEIYNQYSSGKTQNVDLSPTDISLSVMQMALLQPLSRKRKIIVIAEEDELDNENGYDSETSEQPTTRAAKQSAEIALKCYISSDNDDNDRDENYVDGPSNNESDFDNYDIAPLDINRNAKDNETNNGDILNVDSAACNAIAKLSGDSPSVEVKESNQQPVPKKKKKKYYPPRKKSDPPKLSGQGSWYPFLIAEGDILLYKYGTFVVKTHTQLICKAHKCKFQTEFDYYSSFQIMKKHIEDKHRNVAHRQRTLHPCLMCNIRLQNQFEFRKHIHSEHKHLRPPVALAMCECCLAHKKGRSSRAHQFSHKNEEEKAVARNLGDGNTRCLRLKESETNEKKYVCDWENCTAAFKTSGNLIRHKRSHLPVESRADMTVCSECGIWILKESYDSHMKRIHRPDLVDRILACPVCDKKFLPEAEQRLKTHIRIHRGERPFLCTQCPATFADNSGLRGHIRHVHDIRPYPCSWCDKIYSKRFSLTSHIQRRHPEKYESKPCFRKMSKFYYDEELEKSLKEKFVGPIQMFPCPVCEVVCKYRFTLRKHMLKHTKHNDSGMNSIGSRSKKSGVRSDKYDDLLSKTESVEGQDYESKKSMESYEGIAGPSSGNLHSNMFFPTLANNHNISFFR